MIDCPNVIGPTFIKLRIITFLVLVLTVAGCSKPAVQNQIKTQLNDAEDRHKFHDELQGYLQRENFAKLEQIAQELSTKKLRFAGGDWKLDRFYENVANPPGGFKPEQVDWKNRLEKIEKWTHKYPNSIYANVALGSAQIGYAWNLRGSGFAKTVDTKEWAGFRDWLLRGENTLNKMSERRKECIAWYRAMQMVFLGLGRDRNEIASLTDEGIAVEPLYWDIYEGYAMYLLPRWHGSQGEWEQFAEEASARLDESERKILYSEICWQMSRFYQPVEFFKQAKVSWPEIKSGFIAREKRYGESIRYLNAFALMAGSAADKLTTRVVMSKIGDRWEPDFWKEKKYFDGYKKWANE